MTRWPAALALGELGVEEAVPPLVAALKDHYVNVRISAAEALEKLKSPASVSGLIQALADEEQSGEFIDYAQAALRAIGDPGGLRAVERADREWG